MRDEEAAAVLARGLPVDAPSRPALIDLAKQLGCWPLLLGLANARLLEEQKARHDVGECIAQVFAVYLRKGVLGFDHRDSTARNAAVARSVEVGLEHAESIYPGIAARASALGIFPEDVAIPVRVLADLWGLDEFDTKEDVVRPLANVCVVEWDRERDEVSLHDIIRRVLATRLADAAGSHRRLVDAWGNLLQLPHDYAWRRLAFHLIRGQRVAQLRTLLCDFTWLRTKLEATDITALVADFETFMPDDPLWLVQGALLLSSAYLAADKAQLASQIVGRLLPGMHDEIDHLLRRTNALARRDLAATAPTGAACARRFSDPRLSRLCRRTPGHRAFDRDGLGGLLGCVCRQFLSRPVPNRLEPGDRDPLQARKAGGGGRVDAPCNERSWQHLRVGTSRRGTRMAGW